MVDGLVFFLVVYIVFGMICGAIWQLAQFGITKGLEWLIKKLGFSGPGHKVRPSEEQSVASVFQPFTSDLGAMKAKGKVLYHGEIWNGFCDLALAPDLKKGDRVEVARNNDLSLTVKRKIYGD